MADCFATPSCANSQPMRICPKGVLLMPRNLKLRSQQRECLLFGKRHHTFCLSTSKFSDVQAPILLDAEGHRGLNDLLKCYCWGTLVDPENAAPTNLVSAMDQVLLMVSAIFAYMAGAVTQRRLDFLSDCTNQGSSSTTYGRSEISENKPSSKTGAVWAEVNKKILGALNANLDNRAVIADMKGVGKRYSLSLFALNEGPTWRLLWVTLWSLQKEVFDIQSSHEAVNRADWLMVVYELFEGIISQIWTKWLEEELSWGIGSCNMNLVSPMQERLKGNDVILNNIKRSGKTELYGDLLYFLKFGYLSRSGCCLDTNFLVNHGVEILEDLMITLADAVACIFLELISVDSDFSVEINSLGLKICPLSTRVLQRLRNEVVLKQWIHQNFESVICLFEDRFELFVLFREKMEDNLEIQSKRSIWQRLIFRKHAAPSSTLNCIQIISISLSAKRTKELQALTGWRYYFSLFLEFSDLAMPVVKTLFDKARNAVSFFLMCMIGRSLGLIFSGIRQSLGWK